MIKSAIAAVAATPFLAASALAGPYVNVENNAGWAGNDFTGSVTDLHVGYESAIGESGNWYVQGGPALVALDGQETTTEASGKIGAGVALTDRLGAYAEVSAITADSDDLNFGTKAGVKYSF